MAKAVEAAILLCPGFQLASMALIADCLRVANRELGRELGPELGRELGRAAFAWRLVTADGAPALSSSGVEIAADAAVQDAERVDVAVVLASYAPERACAPPVLGWLRRLERRGATLACADTGGLVLARAGVLGGRRIAVHHEATPAYREALGEAVLLDRAHAEDGRLLSSGGGVATADMALALIARFAGAAAARRTGVVMNHQASADRAAPGAGPDLALARVDRRAARLVQVMRASLGEAVTIAELCRRAGVERSSARRLFVRRFGETPGRYLTGLRLERARRLLGHGALSVGEIAQMAGFADPSSFARAYRRRFARAPSDDRTPRPDR